MRRFMLLLGIIGVLLVGCGALEANTTPVSPGVAQPDAPSASLPQSVSPPLDLDLLLDQQRLKPGEMIPLTLEATLGEGAAQVIGTIHTTGVVTVAQPAEQTWQNVSSQQKVALQTTIKISGLGAGQITGEVQVLDAAGTTRYGRDMTVYVLATEQGILTGTVGPQQLKREQLTRAHAAGTLSDAEYQKALEQLQYGGAQESITIVVPTKVP